MKSIIHQNRHYLALEIDEEVITVITQYAKEHGITTASITGIGAVKHITLRYYDLATKKYIDQEFAEDHEVLSMMGNISLLNGAPFAHIHIALGGRDFSAIGGHLGSATVAVTLECIIDASPVSLERTPSERTGLNLWNCPN